MWAIGKGLAGAALALTLAMVTAERADAGPGTLAFSGTMDGTVDSTPFSVTAFTAVASFSPGPNLGGGGFNVFPAVFSFDITGVGSYLTATPPSAFAITISPPAVPVYGTYGVEIQAPGGAATAFFDTADTTWLPSGDRQTVFSTPPLTVQFEQSGPLALPLAGGGTLTVNFDSFGTSATLTVPEPGTLALFCFGLVAITSMRRSRRC